MTDSAARTERQALVVSIAATAVLGAVGVVWGIAGGSQMILLDGVYAFVGIAVSGLLLVAAAVSRQGPTRRFQYGREAATPLAIGIQGFVLAATLLYAASEGAYSIRAGGSDVAPGWAMLYGGISAAGSLLVWVWLRGRSSGSDLLVAEATAWRVAALRGVGMVLGFFVMFLLVDSRWDRAAPYVDPAMVLVTCVVFLPAPLRMLRATLVELLEGTPADELHRRVLAHVGHVSAELDLGDPEVRVAKIGPKLYLEVEARVPPDVTVAQQHHARSLLRERLRDLPYEVWLNFELVPEGDDPPRT